MLSHTLPLLTHGMTLGFLTNDTGFKVLYYGLMRNWLECGAADLQNLIYIYVYLRIHIYTPIVGAVLNFYSAQVCPEVLAGFFYFSVALQGPQEPADLGAHQEQFQGVLGPRTRRCAGLQGDLPPVWERHRPGGAPGRTLRQHDRSGGTQVRSPDHEERLMMMIN